MRDFTLLPFVFVLFITPVFEAFATSTVQANAGYYLRRSRMTNCKVTGVLLKEESRFSEKGRIVWTFQVATAKPSQEAPCPPENTEIEISVPQGEYRVYDGKVVYSESIETPPSIPTPGEITLYQTTTTEGAKRWLIQSVSYGGSSTPKK